MKKSLIAGLSATALVASAASVALMGGSPATAAGEPSSAFGIEATGLIPIDATPFVESTDGSLVEDTLVDVPGDPVINAGVVNVGAENGHAYASVADITLGDGLLAELPAELTGPLADGCTELTDALADLEAELEGVVGEVEGGAGELLGAINDATQDTPIDTSFLDEINDDLTGTELALLCDVLAGDIPLATVGAVEAECNGDTGTTTVGDITLLGGVDADVFTTITSAVGVEDLLVITEKRTTDNADGTFTIDGLVVQLLPGTDAEAEIVIASATCGEITADAPPTDEPDAPEPTPGPGDLPVTG